MSDNAKLIAMARKRAEFTTTILDSRLLRDVADALTAADQRNAELEADVREAYSEGYAEGNVDGYHEGYSDGNSVGYQDGYSEGSNTYE